MFYFDVEQTRTLRHCIYPDDLKERERQLRSEEIFEGKNRIKIEVGVSGVIKLNTRHRMSARPPPARPHVGPHLSSFGASDWVEDDAWDSASDSESPHLNKSWNPTKQQSSPPKNVPGKIARTSSSSSSNLASSYTHIHPPNPSSYPPKLDIPSPNKGGWTLVKTSGDKDQKPPPKDLKDSDIDHDTLATSTISEVADELVVGDFDDPVLLHGPSLKVKESRSSVRKQVDEIVAGASKVVTRALPSWLTPRLRSSLPVKKTT
jgi:TBC1 domain family member 2